MGDEKLIIISVAVRGKNDHIRSNEVHSRFVLGERRARRMKVKCFAV